LLLVALLSSIFMSACGSSTATVAKGCKPDANIDTATLNLVQTKQLTIASDITYPPQEFVDPTTHNPTGMEIDLAKKFAAMLCLVPNIQNVQFNTIIAGITAGTPGNQYYDMSISAFTITPDRLKVVDMIPYFTAGESLLVPAGNSKGIKSLTDLCGLGVAVEAGTIEEGEIKGVSGESSPGLNEKGGACASKPVKLISESTQDLVLQQLQSGSVDATYQDSPVSGYYNKKFGGTFVEVSTVASSPEGLVVRNDNAPLENAIKQVLTDIRADGSYKLILDHWGLTSSAYPALP